MNLNAYRNLPLKEIATLERGKKGEFYEDCVIIRLSATDGQVRYIKEPQEVSSDFAIIRACVDWLDNYYLFFVLEMIMPDFLVKYQSGININPKIFDYMKLDLHTEPEAQKYVVEVLGRLRRAIELEEELLYKYQQTKEFYLDGCFV